MKEAILLLDVGGTHTRARLVQAGEDVLKQPDIIEEKSCDISDKQTFLAFIRDLLPGSAYTLNSAVLSFAGPVYDQAVGMTNWREHDEIHLSDLLALGLPEQRTLLINDMEAAANCLIAYKTGAVDLTVTGLYDAGTAAGKHFNNAILIIPGTGIGVAAIILPGADGSPSTPAHVSCELQHTAVPDLGDDYAELADTLKRTLDKKILTWEDFVSGKGLENVHHALRLLGGDRDRTGERLDAGEIAGRAVAGSDKYCEAALACYYHVAGVLTQVVALAFQPFAGIYLSGGTSINNQSFIEGSSFVAALQDNAVRRGLLQSFPVYLIPEYMNLNGTLYLARRRYG